jgi:hypothetical protein
MNELSLWDLLECVKINLANFAKTNNRAFFALACEQLERAIKQAEREQNND